MRQYLCLCLCLCLADVATLCSPNSASHASDGHEHTTAPRVTTDATESREVCPSVHLTWYTCLYIHLRHVNTTQVGTHPVRSAAYKRSACTALAGTHCPVGADPRAGTGPFPEPRALVLPMVKFGQSKPDGLGHIDTADSDLMHHQYRLSVLQWNPGPARRNPTNIIAAACGRFHAVILHACPAHSRSIHRAEW